MGRDFERNLESKLAIETCIVNGWGSEIDDLAKDEDGEIDYEKKAEILKDLVNSCWSDEVLEDQDCDLLNEICENYFKEQRK